MQLKEGETIIKIYHHHPTSFVFRTLKLVVVGLPFYFVAGFISGMLTNAQIFWVFAVISLVFGAIIAYDFIFYYMDRLIITSERILHIDWKSAFQRMEHEAELTDIQDIATKETGLLSALKIFDYGSFVLETASTNTSIAFLNAPDPEGIKHFVYHLNIKPSRIGSLRNATETNDRARQIPQTEEDKAAISRN